MKSLQDHLRQYVAARRALGTQLLEPAKTLSKFVQFLGRKKSKFITIPLALEWSQQSKNVQRATWARKLSMVRQFARWLSVIDPRHQVPPPRLLNVRHRRNKPHIYSDQEIVRLMTAAAALKSTRGLKGQTLRTLIGLLAATGLRPGEAAALENQDVDFEGGVLVIRESKFGKSRLVPVHKSVVTALEKYARERNRIFPPSMLFSVLCLRSWHATGPQCRPKMVLRSLQNLRLEESPRRKAMRPRSATSGLASHLRDQASDGVVSHRKQCPDSNAQVDHLFGAFVGGMHLLVHRSGSRTP